MFELKFDLTAFEAKAQVFGQAAQDQVPFALSLALNRAVEEAQSVIINETWPRAVTVRNPTFLRAALRRVYSTKRDLRVEVRDVLGRGSLLLHADGGTKTPRGANFAIPVGQIKASRGAHGVTPSQRPRALLDNPKASRAVRITPKGIFIGKKGKGLVMAYAFKSSTNQPKDVPFREDFALAMREGARTSFPAAMKRALATKR